jgi:hypothetical protein
MEEQKISRANLFRQKNKSNELVKLSTSDGCEWDMTKPSSKYFFDLFLKQDVTIGALAVDTTALDEENATKESTNEELAKQADKIIPIYNLMSRALMRFSVSPKIVDAGVEPGDNEVSLDEFPSFDYMTDLFNKLMEAAGVPVNNLKEHETFREEVRADD